MPHIAKASHPSYIPHQIDPVYSRRKLCTSNSSLFSFFVLDTAVNLVSPPQCKIQLIRSVWSQYSLIIPKSLFSTFIFLRIFYDIRMHNSDNGFAQRSQSNSTCWYKVYNKKRHFVNCAQLERFLDPNFHNYQLIFFSIIVWTLVVSQNHDFVAHRHLQRSFLGASCALDLRVFVSSVSICTQNMQNARVCVWIYICGWRLRSEKNVSLGALDKSSSLWCTVCLSMRLMSESCVRYLNHSRHVENYALAAERRGRFRHIKKIHIPTYIQNIHGSLKVPS